MAASSPLSAWRDYWEATLTNAVAKKENELPHKEGLFVQSGERIKKLPKKLPLNLLLTCSSSSTMTETSYLQQHNPKCSFCKATKSRLLLKQSWGGIKRQAGPDPARFCVFCPLSRIKTLASSLIWGFWKELAHNSSPNL